MKYVVLLLLLAIASESLVGQTPTLLNSGVCVKIIDPDNQRMLTVVGDLKQTAPNLPGVANQFSGTEGANIYVTGNVDVGEGGADLLEPGSQLSFWLEGGEQILSRTPLAGSSLLGRLNFYNLIIGGTGNKILADDIELQNVLAWTTNQDVLSRDGSDIRVPTDNVVGAGDFSPTFLFESRNARFRDEALISAGSYTGTSTIPVVPTFFNTEKNFLGSGFLFRQNDITEIDFSRRHQSANLIPGSLDSYPLEYIVSTTSLNSADVGIDYTLVDLEGANTDDLTVWMRPFGTNTFTNLGADEISSGFVVVRDLAPELTEGNRFYIAPCPAPAVSLEVPVQSTLCQFQANTLEVVDPGGDFTYLWSTGETSRTVDIIPTTLDPVNYSVTVTDAGKCFRTFDIPLIVLPTPGVDINPALTTSDTLTLCQDAEIVLDPTVVFTDMNNPDYVVEYLWSTGETTPTIELVGDGSGVVDTITLSVRVTNFSGSAAGCERTDTLYLRNEILPGFDLGPDQDFCDGTTSTTLTTGITDPTGLSIVWTLPDATTFMGPELNATQTGFYSVAVNNGECTVMDGTTVNFSNLSGTAAAVPPDCHPDDTDPGASPSGTLAITLSSGVGPFNWFVPELGLNGGAEQLDFIISSTFPEPEILADTDYTVEIFDEAANCMITIGPLSFSLPVPLGITPTIEDDVCGTGGGSISVTTSGGTGPYTYTWSTGAEGLNLSAITDLSAGLYTLTVTDAKFCQQFFTDLEVAGAATGQALTLSVSTSFIDCPGGTSPVTLSATGGNPGYLFSTNGTDFNEVTEYDLPAGNYTFFLQDSEGCTAMRSVTINEGDGPVLPVVQILEPILCTGESTSVQLEIGQQQQSDNEYSLDGIDFSPDEIISGLTAGNYRLYVRNFFGCLDSVDFAITEPQALAVDAATAVDADVCGLGEGAINLVVTGGTGELSYSWDTPGGATDCCPQGLFAGTYNVTVSDENSCTLEEQVIVGGAAGALQVVNSEGTDPTCSDLTDGSISITLDGGTLPYRYQLNGSLPQAITSNTLVLNDLSGGDYNFTLLDANNCSVNTSVLLTTPEEIVIELVSTSPSGCADEAIGSIDLAVSGPSDLQVLWDDGPTTANRDDLVAGNYTVTAFRADHPECLSTLTISVAQLPSPELSFTMLPDVCLDGTGALTVSATGGTGLLAFDWNDGPTGSNRTDLAAGTYMVTVTDENSCTDAETIVVSGPNAPLSLTTTVNNISCFGENDGSIIASPSGGTGAYSFAWSNAAETFEITAIATGDYSLTVTDEAGCTVEETLSVTSPDELNATALITDVQLTGGATGSIDVTALGGTEPFEFFWDVAGTPLADTEDLENVPAGIYNLIIVDANGCLYEQTYAINEPSALILVITEDQFVSCAGATDGALSATVTGGDETYSYVWTLNGDQIGDTAMLTGLIAGTYILQVTDGAGNTITRTYNLEEPELLTVTPTVINPSCFDLDDGEIILTESGGTSPYSYTWEDGTDTDSRASLAAGLYAVTVTDDRGCTVSTASITITAPAALALSANVEAISAPEAEDGSIDLTVSGGSGGYIFSWDNGAQTEDLINLAPGEYSVTVTDANACTAEATFSVVGSNQLQVNAAITGVTCPGDDDGSIILMVSGGANNFFYLWDDGTTGPDREDLSAGEYSVTISDPVAEDFEATYTVPAAEPILFELTVVNVDCAGNENGSIVWNSGASGGSLTGLAAGAYSVTITNDAGCQVVVDTVITEPENLMVQASATAVSTSGGSDGAIDLMVSGGTEPYTFSWAPGGQTTEDLMNLEAGEYTVTVTDARFCTEEISVDVIEPSTILLSGMVTDARCNGEASGAIAVAASGGTGFLMFQWADGPSTEDRENLLAGSYRLVVTDLAGNQDSIAFTVNEPDALVANETLTDPACPDDDNGSITLAASGGNGGFAYIWEDGSTESFRTDLPAGDYPVTISDAEGCTAALSFALSDPQPLSLTFTLTQPGCGPADLGTIDLTVSGGTPDYDFTWVSGQSSEDLINVGAGSYSVTVTDANGCSQDSSIVLSPVGDLSLTANVIDVLCSGDATGSIEVVVLPEDPDLDYNWSNGATTASITNLLAGDYGLTVTSPEGCSLDTVLSVTAPDALVANVNTTAAGCTPAQGGGAFVVPEGGVPNYTYVWSTGATTALLDDLAAGSYSVTVTDENNCTTTATASIMEADADLDVHFLAATPVDAEEQIQFVDVTFPAPQSVFWEFNDPAGSTSSETNPLFAYPDNEDEDLVVYPAMLSATSLFCEDQLIKDITVISLNRRDAPDAPNVQRPVYANLEDIALYPNPTPDYAEITVLLNLEADITVSLVDAAGHVLTTDELSGSDRYDWVIDVRRLPPAVYFVRVETAFGVSTRKLVVD